MVRQTTKVIILEIFGVISLILMAAVATLAIMLIRGPVELGFFRDDVEAALTNARAGREVSIERLTLQWSPGDRRLYVVANDLSFEDGAGQPAGFVNRAELTLDAGAILLGNIDVIATSLNEGWVNIQNTGPNSWALAGDPLPEIRAGALPQTPQEWLDRVNAVLSDVLNGFVFMEDQTQVEDLFFEEMELRVLSLEGEQIGSVQRAAGAIEWLEGDLSISIGGDGQGVGLPEIFEVSMDTFEGYQSLQTNFDVGVLPISELAQLFGLGGMEQGDLRVGTSFGAKVSRETGLEEVSLVIASQEGELLLPTFSSERIGNLNAALRYRPLEDRVLIERLDLTTNHVSGVFTGALDNVLATNSLRRISLSTDLMGLDLTPIFEAPFEIGEVSVEAELSDDFTIFAFEKIEATLDGTPISASGELDLDVDPPELDPEQPEPKRILPFSLDLKAEITGEFDKSTVLAYWPVEIGKGGRRFVDERIESAIANGASAEVSLKPDSFAQGFLRDEDLSVSFGFRDGQVRFLSDMPPVANAIGTGTVRGNSLNVRLISGTYDDWTLQTGDVDFPAFNPRGEPFTVRALGEGPAVSILRQLSESRLQLQERTGFDPERVSGTATASLQLKRPSLTNVPFEDIELTVRGKIRDAGLKNTINDLDLTDGSVEVDLTQDRLILTGFGDLGTSPVQFTWRDALSDDNMPADLSATAVVTPDFLNTFGLVGRAFLTGNVPVELQGQVGAEGMQEAAFSFDLSEARIDLSEIGWIKPSGEPARATLSYTGDLRTQASAVRLESETAILDGDLLLGTNGRLESLSLRRLFLRNIADVAGSIGRKENGGFEVALNGAFLDISTLLPDIGAVGGAGEDAIAFDIDLDARVERLKMRQNLDLLESSLSIRSTNDGLEYIRASGTAENGAAISASLEAVGVDDPMRVSIQSSDAGFLTRALFGIDFISGGALKINGTLATPDQPARLTVSATDTRLRDAPFFTQILSLASLRGLTDTLSGDGVLFTRIDLPIQIGGGRYVIDGGRASGPALGLTVNGWIGTDARGIELDGVLVPSFGVNSMLGGVPIIGDLFVGREGEGIFSITYSVGGTLDKAQVAVNPLSAVTPGILRRIFENPSDTSIPETLPVDPNLKPPTAKLPDLPDEEILSPTPGSGG